MHTPEAVIIDCCPAGQAVSPGFASEWKYLHSTRSQRTLIPYPTPQHLAAANKVQTYCICASFGLGHVCAGAGSCRLSVICQLTSSHSRSLDLHLQHLAKAVSIPALATLILNTGLELVDLCFVLCCAYLFSLSHDDRLLACLSASSSLLCSARC